MTTAHPAGYRWHVFHLGLSYREVLVLESLFRLHGDLQRHYSFGPYTDANPADILFVDGDDPQALAAWNDFVARHPAAVAVMVCTSPAPDAGTLCLTRPLNFRKLEEVRYALRCATPADSDDPDDGNLRVLIVDDGATTREQLQQRLATFAADSRLPVQVDFAESGDDALHMAAVCQYDLVFLDLVTPGVDGFEICHQLKQAHPVRIAMLSHGRTAADYDRGHRAGCDHYLAKPVPADMVNTVLRLTAMKKAMPAW